MDFEEDAASSRPIIGITGRVENDPRPCNVLNLTFSQSVYGGGGLPVVLPVSPTKAVRHLLERLDGLIISGGEDINPLFYGQPPHARLGRIHSARDEWELGLVRACLELGKPLLGICRGVQVLQVALGGQLYQDLPSQKPDSFGHTQMHARTDPIHQIQVQPDTLLSRLLGQSGTLAVNSIHHQALIEAPSGYRVSAQAADGVIEAIEAVDGRPVLGVQWHPELMDCPIQRKLFTNFVKLAGQNSLPEAQ